MTEGSLEVEGSLRRVSSGRKGNVMASTAWAIWLLSLLISTAAKNISCNR